MPQSILIIAGEASGDNIGGLLCAELRLLRPNIQLFGLGGDRMDASGVRLLYHANQLAFLGFWEVLKHLPFIRQVERRVIDEVKLIKPSLAILIDYPGFNLRLAARLKDMGVPVMYYVSPQVWAWGKGRIARIKRLVDRMVVVFRFEQDMYRDEGVAVEWYGHPLLEVVKPRLDRASLLERIGLSAGDRYIGLFPGSRKQEIENILPVMVATLSELQESGSNLKSVVGCAAGIDDDLYRTIGSDKLIYARALTYDVMAHSELNLVASGTATLESAILGKPLFVLYKTSTVTYHIARNLIKIPFIGLVNVVAGKKVVPEFIQGECRPMKIVTEVRRFLSEEPLRKKMAEDLSRVKSLLGNEGASRKVAETVLQMVGAAP